jgi:NADH:ubiquinone oxidoreductase subunit F (NADH-binding)
MEAFKEGLTRKNLQNEIMVVPTGCHGMCEMGPIVVVYPEGTFYCRVSAADVDEIIEEHLYKGRVVERLLYKESEGLAKVPHYKDIPFYSKMKPEDVVQEVKASGLRGRGGGGFPTGLKWEFCARSVGDKKYVICNADEGDPGAFMDRSILEGDPHALIEGMMIGAYAMGANEGYIYCRAEYPLAIKRLNRAISQAEEYGLLGKNILDTDFSFDLHIKEGAGAFVCGEETALMASIEGQRGMPRPRPPFPANRGLWGKPTNINNVETWANVPTILRNGAEWYSAMGTEKSKGTKVFALTGKINHTGLVEVPMGLTIREVVFDLGGGILNGKKFKAVQIGGPSGGCLTEEHLDLPISYESLTAAGAIMGSGGLVVMDEDNCMVDVAKFFLEFTQRESCGKCVPCREGTKQMLLLLNKITKGEGTMEDLQTLEDLAHMVKEMSLCGLGQTAPNPVLTTLRYFRHEYEAHIKEKRCPAGVCVDLIHFMVDPEKCKKCGLCAKNCPVNCISGDRQTPYLIDQERCIKCGTCLEKCPFDAISKK